MPYEVRAVSLGRIYLDNDNPRHVEIESEPQIIAHLIEKDGVKPLARDIAETGKAPPSRVSG